MSDRLSYTTYSYRNRDIYKLRYKFGSVYVESVDVLYEVLCLRM